MMSKRLTKIHPTLQKLIASLRTAVVSDEWKLDKQQTSRNDVLTELDWHYVTMNLRGTFDSHNSL